ncbi:DUF1574 domain-containing protein [Oscillatoriales cyanobacterium LEGE 11467]|uniref:DUF1574 domain-containing protein n=1 Tax=Zarconia navalis LEGE 11467 TaxID=1828826 RepID=A0A928VZ23_9CYAN|nr:DUF1574 domain-containing protein [Zarconia navalis]MBE9041898.1 DUF1574 domain-containing protein [Zarconia navalis LEGE 11467]
MVLNVDRKTLVDSQLALTQWAYQALDLPGVQLKVQVRDKQLHIWCEGRECPDATVVMARFSQAIHQDLPLPEEQPAVTQVFLYGRQLDGTPEADRASWDSTGSQNLDWTVRFEVNPSEVLKERLSQLKQNARLPQPDLARKIARPDNPQEIAEQLNAAFGHLGMSIKVSIKHLEDSQSLNPVYRRLWVLCESTYAPDPTLLGSPIAQHLRDLNLQGFRDAAILGQVSGEPKPEWMLRVDLTPPDRIINTWAHWGDVAAISERLNQALAPQHLQVSAILKETTLHIFCCPRMGFAPSDSDPTAERRFPIPDRESVMNAIAPTLKLLAPRGIQAATAYGLDRPYEASFPEPSAPGWVAWLDLPAASKSSLAVPTLTLAREGSLKAIAFSIERLLNPDLAQKLLTGGIRIKIRRKSDLLHVMSEGLICPQQSEITEPIVKFLRQLQLIGIAGVRIYGRRSGQKQPRWSYGVDFVRRTFQNRDAMPDFAASEADVGDLLPQPDLSAMELDRVPMALHSPRQSPMDFLQTALCRTPFFAPQSLDTAASLRRATAPEPKLTIAAIWGTLGILFTFAGDLWLGQMLEARASLENARRQTGQVVQLENGEFSSPPEDVRPDGETANDVFNPSGFTAPLEDELGNEPARKRAAENESLAEYSFPSFNSDQFDNQLALYQNYVGEFGIPDVLVVGSSRSLRGLDPATLQQTLAAQGYPDIRVFNFGINGATAQVINLLIGKILPTEELPELIVWADGARAFNSGREDRTYDGIVQSAGYEALSKGLRPIQSQKPAQPISNEPERSFFQVLTDGYQDLDDRINDLLAVRSSTYDRREELSSLLLDAIDADLSETESVTDAIDTEKADDGESGILYANGFLALSDRFDPATYYENHPKVPGDYDSDYKSFQLRGKQATAFSSLVEFVRSRDSELVFVNLPLTENYLDPVRMRYERDFQQYMLANSKEWGFVFRNLFDLLLGEPEYFSDPSHLNRYGARSVSQRLAQDPMMPWLAGSDGAMGEDGETQ